jgi:malate dehydrogenase (oxaloacetate-decarboxylating)(NADP+)
MTAETVSFFNHDPKIAILSYSNFGSIHGEVPDKVARAVQLARKKYPDLVIEGDIQANVALDTTIQNETYKFSQLVETGANTLIFPDLQSGNIAYKLLMELGGAHAIGPILLGMNKAYHVLQMGSSVREIVNMTAIAGIHARLLEKINNKK